MTWSDIHALINGREKESINIELKSFRKVLDKEKREENFGEIACEIVALCNRNGGKLILGINDDGSFDGKFNGDIDSLKRDIQNICYDKISPIVDYNTQFLQSGDADLFIIHVPKRKLTPHAYIPKRSGKEIKSRIYYIRTSHGKKLINDVQLEWMFHNNNDPNFSHSFRVGMEFDRNLNLIGSPIPHGSYSIINFINQLDENDRKLIKEDSTTFHKFFVGLFPFFILDSIADYYSHSWYIGIDKEFDRTSSGPMKPLETSLILEVPKISRPHHDVIDSLSWDFDAVLDNIFGKKIHLPLETKIEIEYRTDRNDSKLILRNLFFTITIHVGMLSAGSGLHCKSSNYEIITARDPIRGYRYSVMNFYHFDGATYLDAVFDFPEDDTTLFNKYLHYFNTLKELITTNWDFESIRKKLPPKEFLVIDDKLNEILQLLKNNDNIKD